MQEATRSRSPRHEAAPCFVEGMLPVAAEDVDRRPTLLLHYIAWLQRKTTVHIYTLADESVRGYCHVVLGI